MSTRRQISWGVTGRGLCGASAGAQRAHDLNWRDTVGDMTALRAKAKTAQLADLKDGGELRRTASRLLVGENVAVETNNPDVRSRLNRRRFLYLNRLPGFSAPAGYRLERAKVEGCVLTDCEPGHPAR